MPQRSFWTKQVPTKLSIVYEIEPTEPDKPAFLRIEVRDQANGIIERAGCTIPLNVVFECTKDVLGAAWEAYLFGETGGLQRAIAPVVAAWRHEAATRPLWQ